MSATTPTKSMGWQAVGHATPGPTPDDWPRAVPAGAVRQSDVGPHMTQKRARDRLIGLQRVI
jgi:hypothetical protein